MGDAPATRRINGSCHCGNVSYVLEWPGEAPAIPVRGCGCTFCSRHGARWTSHPARYEGETP